MIRVPRSTLSGSCAHQLDHLVERGVVQPIDLVVVHGDPARPIGIGVDERSKHAVDKLGAEFGHLGQMDVAFERRLRGQLQDLLGDR